MGTQCIFNSLVQYAEDLLRGFNIDKRNFKQYLEDFFDMIFYCLESENGIACSAAEECIKSLSSLLGPNILRGSVENYNLGFLNLHDKVFSESNKIYPIYGSANPIHNQNTPGCVPGSTFNSSSKSIVIPRSSQRESFSTNTPTLGGTPPP